MSYPTEFGDYDEMYGSIDYQGATVLDIGADYGTSATYFLEKGAVKVVVSEKNLEWQGRLFEMAVYDGRIIVVDALSDINIDNLFFTHQPDVVKVDCEGCEQLLLGAPAYLLKGPRAWVIETHTRMLLDELRERFRLLGFRVKTIKDYGPMKTNPDKHVAVFTAIRRT